MYPVITNTVVLDALVCVALITFANVLVKRFFAKKLDYNKVFRNKVVVITGASSGIGAELAGTRLFICYLSSINELVQLASYGPKLVLAARRVDRLADVKSKCEKAGAQIRSVLLVQTDVAMKSDCEKLIQTAVAEFSGIDVLHINAGIAMATSLFKCQSPDVLEQVMNVNVNGATYTAFYALPHIRKSQGIIVVTSSVLSFLITRGTSAYCASKAALNSFFSCVRLEEARNIVKVCIICPGHVATEIQKQSLGSDGQALGKTEVSNLGFEVSLEKAARIMIDATVRSDWFIIFTSAANVLCRVRACLPEYFDRYVTRMLYG